MLFKITAPVLNKEIEVLDISNRARNCMNRLKCKTVEDFIDKQYEIADAKGVGTKTITEIKNKILELQIEEATRSVS